MKKLILLFIFLVLAGCSRMNQVDVYEVNDSSEAIEGSHITLRIVKLWTISLKRSTKWTVYRE